VELWQRKLLATGPYEVVIGDRVDLARTLANWERQTAASLAKLAIAPVRSPRVATA